MNESFFLTNPNSNIIHKSENFRIFEIRGKRFEYSNNIRAKKLSNLIPNIRDSRKKIRIRIESEYIRSPLVCICRHWLLELVLYISAECVYIIMNYVDTLV